MPWAWSAAAVFLNQRLCAVLQAGGMGMLGGEGLERGRQAGSAHPNHSWRTQAGGRGASLT